MSRGKRGILFATVRHVFSHRQPYYSVLTGIFLHAGKHSKATLNSDVQMQPQVCLYTLNLKKDAETDLSATKLEISDGTNSYTVTPTGGAATNSFTVALLPASGARFTFAATTTESGKFYSSNLTLEAGGGITPVAMIAYINDNPTADCIEKDRLTLGQTPSET